LAALATEHRVPGATLGILRVREGRDDEVVLTAHGVLNTATGVEVTTDSLFQIGSITKVWTATLVLQLVDEGLVGLDTAVTEALPDFRLADPTVAPQLTIAQLLTHTSGIDGDVFTDTGRGDDCLERYVAELGTVSRTHPPGASWSYCNSGFCIAGRVVERLTGATWDDALRARLVRPLGLSRTVTLPEEALLFRAAVGHVDGADGGLERAAHWGLPRSVGPAGLITATAADVLTFARLHLTEGTTADGTRLLSRQGARAMAARHAELPDGDLTGVTWGLGWSRFDWAGQHVLGHDGNTIGQASFLRLLPAHGLAVVLLTNGGDARALHEDLSREVFAELADVDVPAPPAPTGGPTPATALGRHPGRYQRAGALIEVFERDGQLVLRQTTTGPLAELVPQTVPEFPMAPLDASGDRFAIREPGKRSWTPVTFYALASGERYVHTGLRSAPRVG
jgi:CubicO group peptidase (beta-lactamase class C family)